MDRALAALDGLVVRWEGLLEEPFSETDTRVKFIDPILTGVLGWDEMANIRREQRHRDDEDRRCVDYVLSLSEPILVVEAKRLLRQFEVPELSEKVLYKLNGVIRTWPIAWSAVTQAREYCDQVGARYALVTNGKQFIAFKALSERGHWTDGSALVLKSVPVLRSHFTEFYQCLSRELIGADRLSVLSRSDLPGHFRGRVRDGLPSMTGGYRNDLYGVLHQVFGGVLLDVAQPTTEFLKECYATNEDIVKYGTHLKSVIVDPLPVFASPIQPVKPGARKDTFQDRLASAVRLPGNHPLVMVLGGPGVGKTTFLRAFFELFLPAKVAEKCLIVWVDFRRIECSVSDLHDVTLRAIISGVHAQSRAYTTSLEQLKQIFRQDVEDAIAGVFKPWADDVKDRDIRVAQHIEKLQDGSISHLRKLVEYLRDHCGRKTIVVLDNMDQKDEDLQEKLWHVAQECVHDAGVIALLAIRESSYYNLIHRPTMNAFSHLDFHVRAQPLGIVLDKRIQYLESRLTSDTVELASSSGTKFEIDDFNRFLQLIARSLLGEDSDPRILECIESLAGGNIRDELQFVYSFLISGQTKIDEYFWAYARDTGKRIPFHEVLHSILLEDQRVFSEARSVKFMNVFDLGPALSASHFTGLRILGYLQSLGQSGALAERDYVSWSQIQEQFVEQGIREGEMEWHLRRMTKYGLLMPYSQDIYNPDASGRMALTRCGVYYFRSLYQTFAYVAAMVVDCEMKSPDVLARCKARLMHDGVQTKLPLSTRMGLAEEFVRYLSEQEDRELGEGAPGRHPVFRRLRFVPAMISAIEETRMSSGRPGRTRS